jgi:copper oxidase (laccase) domain-containing protein
LADLPVPVVREAPVSGPLPLFQLGDARWSGAVAGITGRGSGPGRGFDLGLWSDAPVGEVMSRWRALRRTLPGFDAVVLGNQVHGIHVETVSAARGWVQVDGVDGWVTTARGVLLTVTVADCIPVYLLVPGRGAALLHAGWRGTAGGILAAGAERLRAATGGTASEILMHCGVGICGPCYEVGSEVMLGCGLAAPGTGPWHLDLRTHLVEAGRKLGIRDASVSGWCSAHDRASFYSHRGSRGSAGRMVAYLGMPRAD